jgi:hypothetical protein
MADQGRRPELVGGVMERRLSGWGQVEKVSRKEGTKQAKGDRRIEMARRLGVSTAAVSKAVARGELLAAEKEIDLVDSLERFS